MVRYISMDNFSAADGAKVSARSISILSGSEGSQGSVNMTGFKEKPSERQWKMQEVLL